MFTKTCLICGKEFQSKAHNAKHCSPECRLEAKRRRRAASHGPRKVYSSVCPVCGKPFDTIYAVKKYCSSECYRSARSRMKYVKRKKRNSPSERNIHLKAFFRSLCSVCGANNVPVTECSECGYLVCSNCRNDLGICKICTGTRVIPTIIAK